MDLHIVRKIKEAWSTRRREEKGHPLRTERKRERSALCHTAPYVLNGRRDRTIWERG